MSQTGLSHNEQQQQKQEKQKQQQHQEKQQQQHFLLSNRIIRIVIGLYPNRSYTNQLFRCLFVAACIFPFTFHQFYQFYSLNMDFQSTLTTLPTVIIVLGVNCTFIASNLQFETTKYLVAYLKYDYEHIWDENELCILEKYTKLTKIYTAFFVGLTMLYYISMTIPSILGALMHIFGLSENMNLTLPFFVNNISNSGLIYYSLLFYQITVLLTILTIGCAIYLVYVSYVQHACTLFSILILKIRRPFEDEKFLQNCWHNSQTNKEESKWIINIIKTYIRITEFITLVNKLSKIIYLFGMLFCMIMLMFDIIYILQLQDILQNNIRTILECFSIVFETVFVIYINFYFGQLLIDHSNGAFEELCQVPIYILSKKNQRLLLLITMRCMKPCEMSIGGLFASSHEIFAALLQRSFSFAMAYYNLVQST